MYYFYHGSGEITRKRYRLFRDMAYVISYSNWKIAVPLRSAVKSSAFINLHESKGKEEELTLENLASETLCGGQFTF